MKTFLIISAAGLAAAIALTGCSAGTDSGSMPGMSHGASTSSMPAAKSGTVTDHNMADTMFAQAMAVHHRQAIDMSNTLLAKTGIDPRVSALASRIKAEQGPEITAMTAWLSSWNEPTAMAGGHSMSGMMSDDEMKKLDTAQGTEAGKLFLTQMVMHHEGAVSMAKTEASDGRNADAKALGRSIVAGQEAEIKEMKDLQAAP